MNIRVWDRNQKCVNFINVTDHGLHNAFSFLAVWELIENGQGDDYYNYTLRMEELDRALAKKPYGECTDQRFGGESASADQSRAQYDEHNKKANVHFSITRILESYRKGTAARKRDSVTDNDGNVDLARLKNYLVPNVSSAFWENNEGRLKEIVKNRNGKFITDMEFTIFILFVLIHSQADCDIMEPGSLDEVRYGNWPDSRFNEKTSVEFLHTLLDEARCAFNDSSIQTSGVLTIPSEETNTVKLPAYTPKGSLDEDIQLVRIEKQRRSDLENGGSACCVKVGASGFEKKLLPGEMVFALRINEQYICLLENESSSGGFSLKRSDKDPRSLTFLMPNGASMEQAFDALPADWEYSVSGDFLACVDEKRNVTFIPEQNADDIRNGVMVSICGRDCYVLLQDGRVWSNVEGAGQLENVIMLSADTDRLIFMDSMRRVKQLRGGRVTDLEEEIFQGGIL